MVKLGRQENVAKVMHRGGFRKFPNPDRKGPFVHTICEYSAEKDQPFLFRKISLFSC